MPRPRNQYTDIDKKFDDMTIDDVRRMLEFNDKNEIAEYNKYLTRKANKARALFNGGKSRKKGKDLTEQYNAHWKQLIEKRKQEEKNSDPKLNVNEEDLKNTSGKKKLTSLDVEIISFKKKYLIDIENISKKLEASLVELNSNTRLTKYGEGGKKTYTYVIDDSKKDVFYARYKESYKNKFAEAYKLFLKKPRVELNSNNIDEFVKSYDNIIRNIIYAEKKFYVPYYGGMNKDEMKSLMTSALNVKYCEDSYFDKYLTMSVKDCTKLKAKDIEQILSETHKRFAETLKKAQSEEDPKIQGKRVLESVKKSYLAVDKIHRNHGFFFKLFNKHTVEKEEAFLNAIKTICVSKFKISDAPMTNDEFMDVMASPFAEGYSFIQTKTSKLENICSSIAFNLKNDAVITEEAELEEELEVKEAPLENQNRININVDIKEDNIINENVDNIEVKEEPKEELNK